MYSNVCILLDEENSSVVNKQVVIENVQYELVY